MARTLLILATTLALASTAADAGGGRPDKDWKDWYWQFGAGYAGLSGDANDVADPGWALDGGAMYWPESWPVGLKINLGWSEYDLEDSIVRSFDAEDGDVRILQLTTAAHWSPETSGPVSVSLSGGLGFYDIDAQVTEPGLFLGPICDPWLWWCYPGAIPGDIVTEDASTTRLGYNASIGLTIRLDSGSEVFIEAQYHTIDTEQATELLPIIAGIRW